MLNLNKHIGLAIYSVKQSKTQWSTILKRRKWESKVYIQPHYLYTAEATEKGNPIQIFNNLGNTVIMKPNRGQTSSNQDLIGNTGKKKKRKELRSRYT